MYDAAKAEIEAAMVPGQSYYVGVLDIAKDMWGIRIPDFPGCVGGGATAEEAIADVTAALRDVAAHKREGGFAIAQASTLAEVVASGEIGAGEYVVMIPLLLNSDTRLAPT
jgi:predicted RNase H-like HicB family nuclease